MLRKILIGTMLLLVLATGGFFVWFGLVLPTDMPIPEARAVATPESLARGEYLARHVAVCMDCHSTRDWSRFSGPIVPGTLPKGGERFDEKVGLPGVIISKNITPAALGDWSDGEILRAMAGGISRDGHALFPLMPYDAYRFMDESDALAIIAWVRSIPAIDNPVPRHQLDFPLNLIVNAIPKPPAFKRVDRNNPWNMAVTWPRWAAAPGVTRRSTRSRARYPEWNWPAARLSRWRAAPCALRTFPPIRRPASGAGAGPTSSPVFALIRGRRQKSCRWGPTASIPRCPGPSLPA
ncbi:MAG: hypothetical protein FJ170_06500 [Gammaproteobacteria bacterium]|nr:hypothetical protein [Gammaproteobacteria bacterium]